MSAPEASTAVAPGSVNEAPWAIWMAAAPLRVTVGGVVFVDAGVLLAVLVPVLVFVVVFVFPDP